jgi:hypothetical protein
MFIIREQFGQDNSATKSCLLASIYARGARFMQRYVQLYRLGSGPLLREIVTSRLSADSARGGDLRECDDVGLECANLVR